MTARQILQGEITDKLIVRCSGRTGEIIFNDPQRHNAMSLDMWQGLSRALAVLGADDAIRSVVLAGAGTRAFISGANISQFDALRTVDADVQVYEEISEQAQMDLYHFPKPTIAKIRGYCLGGGLGIALCCDIRIAAENGVFGIPAGRLGLGYRLSAMSNLVRAAGSANALDLFLSARRFKADEARQLGLAHYVVPDDALDAFVQNYVDQVNANAPMTLRLGKEMIRALDAMPASINRDVMAQKVRACYQSADYREGKAAFKEKRMPDFHGR